MTDTIDCLPQHEFGGGGGVVAAICAIKKTLANTGGITKDRQAPAQIGGYQFRGIDDADNVLCAMTAWHGLVLVPRVVAYRSTTQQDAKGRWQRHVEVDMEMDILHADGSALPNPVRTSGEGIDTGDKATGKAFSNARKMALFSLFMVPTHGENVEEHATEVAPPAPVVPRIVAPPNRLTSAEIQKADSFNELLNLTKVAREQSGKDLDHDRILHTTIVAVAAKLYGEAKTMDDVMAGKPFLEALGNPDDLRKVAVAAYNRFRK